MLFRSSLRPMLKALGTFAVLIVGLGCGGGGGTNDPINPGPGPGGSAGPEPIVQRPTEIKSDVAVLPSDDSVSISETGQVVVKGNATGSTAQVGSVIVSAKDAGFLRKVKSVSRSRDAVTFETGPATIEDAVQSGSVIYEGRLGTNWSGTTVPADSAVTVSSRGIEGRRDSQTFSNHVHLQALKIADTLTVTGDFDYDLALQFGLSIDAGRIKQAQAGLRINASGGVTFSGEASILDKKVHIATITGAPITIPLGILPVVLVPDIKLFLTFKTSVTGGLELKTVVNLEASAGVQYSDSGGWAPYSHANATCSPTPNVFAQLTAQEGPRVELSLKLYGIAGPYVSIDCPRANITLKRQTQPGGWSLSGGFSMVASAGFKVEALGEQFVDESFPDFYEADLATFDNFWPDGGAGGGGGSAITRENLVGTWRFYSVTHNGTVQTCPIQGTCGPDDRTVLRADGTYQTTQTGLPLQQGTWRVSGSTMYTTYDGQPDSGTVWLSTDLLTMRLTKVASGDTFTLEMKRVP